MSKKIKKKSNEKKLSKKELNEKELNEKKLNEKKLSKKELNEKKLSKKELNEKELNEKELNEKELNEKKLSKKELNEKELNEKKLSKKELNEKKLSKKELNEKKLNEKELNEKKLSKKELNKKKLNEKELNEKELNEKELNEKKLNEIKLNEKELNEKELNEKKLNEIKLSKNELNEIKLSKKEKKISEDKITEFIKNIDKYELLYLVIKNGGLMVLKSYALVPYPELRKFIGYNWMAYGSVDILNNLNDKSSFIKTDSKGNKVRAKIKINRDEFRTAIKRFTSLTLKPLSYLNKSLSIVSNLIMFHFVIMLINSYTGGSVVLLGRYLYEIFKDNPIIMKLINNIDIQKIQNLSIQDLYGLFNVFNSKN